MAAYHEGQSDPLSYLRDELRAQGDHRLNGAARDQDAPDAPTGAPETEPQRHPADDDQLSADDKFPEVAGVLLGRVGWRYRSELGPLLIAAVTMLTAAVLHATHPVWPGIILAVTAGKSAGAGGFSGTARPDLSRRAHCTRSRRHCGGWHLAGRVHRGRAAPRSPFPQLLVIVGSVLALPWWVHRRRRARVRVDRKLESPWPEDRSVGRTGRVTGPGRPGGRVGLAGSRRRWRAARPSPTCWPGCPRSNLRWAPFRGAARVFPTPDNRAHRFELRVLEIDPHADAIPWPGPVRGHHRRAHGPRPVRGCHPGPRPAAASACAHRRHCHRIGQERRHQRRDGQPIGLP